MQLHYILLLSAVLFLIISLIMFLTMMFGSVEDIKEGIHPKKIKKKWKKASKPSRVILIIVTVLCIICTISGNILSNYNNSEAVAIRNICNDMEYKYNTKFEFVGYVDNNTKVNIGWSDELNCNVSCCYIESANYPDKIIQVYRYEYIDGTSRIQDNYKEVVGF